MQDVNECVIKVKEIFVALEENDSKSVSRIAREISKFEAKADTTKMNCAIIFQAACLCLSAKLHYWKSYHYRMILQTTVKI